MTPSLLMGVGTRHQIIEATAGLTCLSGIGISYIMDWWMTNRLQNIDNNKSRLYFLFNLSVPIAVTLISVVIIAHILIFPGNTLKDMINYSQLNRDVCSFLEKWAPDNAVITGSTLPGMISNYDIVYELQFRNQKFRNARISDSENDPANILILGGETDHTEKQIIQNEFRLNKQFVRGKYFAKVYSKNNIIPIK
ncbi:MAG: hypothetical protein A2161_07115 [Candidatus Schekmanbacteria bacterium RBG_13_48_7]|uniref:Uncharacterized protein n=1 Tax=Candidatus Schekmanbacteria bacterium RBG_13_48_7 TaxID=1817878 RepID=A0A1F7RQH2_9BACT|nr:MAG: hypothetical protein A2161_07115 [Candidatus Schekmanbacteria bacterium RBG_13_48_7]